MYRYWGDISFLTIEEAARLVRARRVSPVELVEAALDRIDAYDDDVRAFLHVDEEGALAAAGECERAIMAGASVGPLCGIPIAVKDIVDVAGLPTTAASRVLAGNVAHTDAAIVARLRAAGAVIIGKTNTHEFAYGVISAPTRNPWDLARIPGGSSGGSAAALTAGMAMGAIGTDTAGSIRLPSALCGVVGLKPTYDVVDRHGIIPLSWSLDHAGPMARGVTDVALLLAAMAPDVGARVGDEGRAEDMQGRADAVLAQLDRPVKGLRIAVPRPYFYDDLDPEVEAAVEQALRALSHLGMKECQAELPDVALTFAVGRAVQRPEASAYHQKTLRATPELYEDETRRDLELGALYLATDYLQGQRVRAQLRERWLAALREVDVLITPTVPVAAPPVPAEGSGGSGVVKGTLLRNTYPFNLAGFPALSVPCGFTSAGLPIGLQIVGRPHEDLTVLRVGHYYQQASAWQTRRSPLTAL